MKAILPKAKKDHLQATTNKQKNIQKSLPCKINPYKQGKLLFN
jgi:hypothetical protein